MRLHNLTCVPACPLTHAVVTVFLTCAASLAARVVFLRDAVKEILCTSLDNANAIQQQTWPPHYAS